MTDTDALEQAARADVGQFIIISNRKPATEAGRVIHDDWHADGPRGRTECGSMGCGMLGRILAIEAAAVREADALREAGELMLSVLGTAPAECNRVGLADPICILHNAEWSTRNGIDLGHCEWIEAREQAGLLWRETATDARP